jgi:hypothetical protein
MSLTTFVVVGSIVSAAILLMLFSGLLVNNDSIPRVVELAPLHVVLQLHF